MIVIGNGESRKNLDISKIKDYKIGCNAVYRDFSIDELNEIWDLIKND